MARPKKEKSLHRGKRVYIRFTELEYELVAGYAKDAGYPIGTFVRKQALREKLEVNYNIVADLGEIQNLTVQVAGIGNNLNQIARYFHSGGLASRGMLEELKRCIAEIRELRQEIVQLGGVYGDFLKSGNKKSFRQAHAEDVAKYEEALRILKQHSPDERFPTMKDLRAEKEQLTIQKDAQYDTYHYFKDYHRELQTVCANVDNILGTEREVQRKQQQSRKNEHSL